MNGLSAPQLAAAVAAARLARDASRALGRGGGSTYPGTLARRIAPHSLALLAARLARGSIVVAGTNGKTTTSRMVSSILRRGGYRPLHNREGANLLSGVTATLATNSSLTGRPFGDFGLFEVDEASLPAVVREVRPRIALLLNLFRDQLDRYGELDRLAALWTQGVFSLESAPTAVINADDPALAALGEAASGRVVWFGLDDAVHGTGVLSAAADALHCRCGGIFRYEAVHYGHLGHWRCPACGRHRPRPDVAALNVQSRGLDGSAFSLRLGTAQVEVALPLPGLYNILNATAAAAAAWTLGLSPPTIVAGLEATTAAFGRLERIRAEGRELVLWLVKNPAGFNEALRTLLAQPGPNTLVIAVNDRTADGHDVSWLWDVDFEALAAADGCGDIVCAGTRAYDMAVRLKYAGLPTDRQAVRVDPLDAVRYGLARSVPGRPLYVFPTYTAMRELRTRFRRLGWVGQTWED